MTNYEKNKTQLDMYGAANVSWGVDRSGKVNECDGCSIDCIFRGKEICSHKRLRWLQEEYKDPEVDWSKVEVDTPILVKTNENYDWIKRYFAGYMWGKVCAFDNGNTSEDFKVITPWKYAKLAEEDD